MFLNISHVTEYYYSEPVSYGLQQLRLTPKSRAGQKIISWRTEVSGGAVQLSYDDHNNNHVELVGIEPGTTRLEIRCHGEVETTDNSGIVGEQGGYSPRFMFLRDTDLTLAGPNVRRLAKASLSDGTVDSMHALMQAILKEVTYDTDATHSATTAEQAVETGGGVCQDHAHIFISVCRLNNIPARYVSGYLMMNDRIDQVATHAWAEAHLPGLGWVGFDVSNGISPDARYVRVATGADYTDAAPVKGIRFGPQGIPSNENLVVSIRVEQ